MPSMVMAVPLEPVGFHSNILIKAFTLGTSNPLIDQIYTTSIKPSPYSIYAIDLCAISV
jgi:hypothetical protein